MTLEAFLHDQLGLDDRWQVTSVVADDASAKVGQASSPLPWWASLPHWSGAELSCRPTERMSAARLRRGGENPEPAIRITVQETSNFWEQEICPQCRCRSVVVVGHQASCQWRHLDLFEHPTILNSALPQGRCRHCKGITTLRPPWQVKSKHFTRQFEEHVLELVKVVSTSEARQMVHETDQGLWEILFAAMDQPAALAPGQIRFQKPLPCPESAPDEMEEMQPWLVGI